MSIPNGEHKSHDGNYIVGDTESLGCEWWGGVRITFYINVYTEEPPNNGHTRSEVFDLCREVVFIH